MAKRSRPRPDLITTYGETSPFAEAYRMLRINLLAADGKALWSVGITGVAPQSGSSTTAANLALIMAETGKRIVLADADLYKPSLHRIFGIPNEVGFSSVLQGEVSLERALHEVTDPGVLRVLPAGPKVRNPAALLRPDTLRAFREAAQEEADFLIVDLPSVGAIAYASFLATFMDGVVLVVRAGTPSPGVERIMKRRLQGVKVVGMVLNGVPLSGSEVPSYRYYAQVKG
jgi:capsular exopolysaccharide synthesis family protein